MRLGLFAEGFFVEVEIGIGFVDVKLHLNTILNFGGDVRLYLLQ